MMRVSIHTLFVAGLGLAALAGCGGGGGGGGSQGEGPGTGNPAPPLAYRLTTAGGLTTTPQDLGSFGPTVSTASGISRDGRTLLVQSFVSAADDRRYPAVFSNGTLQSLGTLGGRFGTANDVNATGQIVGNSTNAALRERAFLYQNGAMADLDSLVNGGQSRAYGINAGGLIVGQSDAPSGTGGANTLHAFAYENGTMRDLGTLGGSISVARAVNASGKIVGFSYVPTGTAQNHAFLYEDGQMKDLGTLGGATSEATGINDAGQISGAADLASGEKHAALFEQGVVRDLGTLGGTFSSASGINASGVVVGSSSKAGNDTLYPFIYKSGTMKDVNTLLDASAAGWTILSVNGVADDGSLAATARKNGVVYAVLLTPNQ